MGRIAVAPVDGFASHDLILTSVLADTSITLCSETFSKDRVALQANKMLARAHAAHEGLGLKLLLRLVIFRLTLAGSSASGQTPSCPIRSGSSFTPDLRRMARVRAAIGAIAAAFRRP
jgi:hypothetical protein